MKVLVGNLSGVKKQPNGSYQHFVKAGSRWPMTVGFSKTVDYYPFPFSLSYTSALLKRDTDAEVKGIDGVVLDMTDDEFIDVVLGERPDVIITELTTLTLKDDLKLLKKLYDEIKCKIVVAGSYVTVLPEQILKENPYIAMILVGEYEFTAKEIVEYFLGETGKEMNDIAGLVYRNSRGEILQTKHRPLIASLDELPYPDREDFPATIYPDFTLYAPCINIISSRGCPAGCIYCVERHIIYNSPKYRVFSPKRIVDEMEYCIDIYGARQFYFDDMSFVVNRGHVAETCEEIKRRGINIPWTCMGDAMFVDYSTLEKMAEAGCIGMKFGIESANQEILKTIGKPLDLEKAKKVVRWSKKLGIRTHATFCLGLPGETVDTIKKTIAYEERLGADTAQVSKAVPYPGTPLYKWATENGYLVTDDYAAFDGTSKAILSYPNLSSEDLDKWYEIFCKKVARQKAVKYLTEPGQSLSIIKEMYKQKGLLSMVRSIKTFLGRVV